MLNAATYTPMVTSGKLRAIAVTGDERLPDLPNVPTLKEQGYTEFGVGTWTGLYAPAGTPKEIVEKLHKTFTDVINSPKTKEALRKYTLYSITSKSPEDFSKWLDAEFTKWTPIADGFREELGMPAK